MRNKRGKRVRKKHAFVTWILLLRNKSKLMWENRAVLELLHQQCNCVLFFLFFGLWWKNWKDDASKIGGFCVGRSDREIFDEFIGAITMPIYCFDFVRLWERERVVFGLHPDLKKWAGSGSLIEQSTWSFTRFQRSLRFQRLYFCPQEIWLRLNMYYSKNYS